ncbi:MAG: sigma 54-interacting transcriptional regulator, partial [Deltaproteobacteria bacterium]|nr:sigma 54-interacting transcriptional regulator [Deltaproteobacteria bacterium]
VRLIAATNSNLDQEVEQGTFRRDMFYRLNTFPVHIPPLRERRADIPVLMNFFLRIISAKQNKNIPGFSNSVTKLFQQYHWPGNVRELENIIERAIVLARDDVISVKDLPLTVTSNHNEEEEKRNKPFLELMTLEEAEKTLIDMALKKHSGVQTRAAKELGISERALRYKIKIKTEKTVD